MRALFFLLFFILPAIKAVAANPIPPELVGEWRTPASREDGSGILYLRPDGLSVMMGTKPVPIGAGGVATYDVKSLTLTLSLREGGIERAQAIFRYDPESRTLKMEPGRDGRIASFKRLREELPEDIKFIALEIVDPKSPAPGIPGGAKHFNGKWYRLYFENGGWKRAHERCRALNGQLAVAPDEPTQAFLKQLAGGRAVWLGATNEREGIWRWGDNSQMTFTAWDAGQPNGAAGEHYLSLWHSGRWHDAFESEPKVVGFICEWSRK